MENCKEQTATVGDQFSQLSLQNMANFGQQAGRQISIYISPTHGCQNNMACQHVLTWVAALAGFGVVTMVVAGNKTVSICFDVWMGFNNWKLRK